MRVVLRRFELQAGQKVAVERSFESSSVTLGRGTDQDVQLPDMRVGLKHAEINVQPGGPYYVAARTASGVWVNGTPSSGRTLTYGDVIELGRFRVTIGPAEPGRDLLLELEEQVSAREDRSRRQAQYLMRLDQGGLGRRRAGWILVLAVLLPGLALPLTLRYTRGEGPTPLAADQVWDSGEFSAAHSYFSQDCGRCHETPFVRVRNSACQDCHKNPPHHSDDPKMLAVGNLSELRCGSCHHEHSGRQELVARHPALCADCHKNLERAGFPQTELMAVTSFERDHPEVTPTLPRYDAQAGTFSFVRTPARENQPWREESNLLFAHDVHVDLKGVDAPEGKRVMACQDCHVAEAGGQRFQPIRMETHCAQCHRLDFDSQAPLREVPHGRPALVAAGIRDYYLARALEGALKPAEPEADPLRRRPAMLAADEILPERRQAAQQWAQVKAKDAMRELFERRICAQCHTVTGDGSHEHPWQITPVSLARSFLTGARFNHQAHGTENCSRCHEAERSSHSTDLLIPPIKGCHDCHGDATSSNLVPSACVDCHGFHIARTATIASAIAADGAAKGVAKTGGGSTP